MRYEFEIQQNATPHAASTHILPINDVGKNRNARYPRNIYVKKYFLGQNLPTQGDQFGFHRRSLLFLVYCTTNGLPFILY